MMSQRLPVCFCLFLQVFLNMPFTKSNIYLWHGVVLSYGSLVYKHCAYYTPCPVAAVQVKTTR